MKEPLAEKDLRYNNALLIEALGQVTARILDVESLISAVIKVLEKHLKFDRGMIMLADKKNGVLRYAAGYGHSPELDPILKSLTFNLRHPDSKGIFVRAMNEHKPFLITNIGNIKESLSAKSFEFARTIGCQSMICVPIIYENEALGIVAVDNSNSKCPLQQSDVSLLMGAASQVAVSIINARSFEKLAINEKKYRELVETANSIILRVNNQGLITFANKFAQRFFRYPEKEMLGLHAGGIITAKSSSGAWTFESLMSALKQNTEHLIVSENESLLKNGDTVWITWTHKPIFDNENRFIEILCIGNDITALKNAEKERTELEAQLQHARQMEAIGTLAGGVAHDLNNILSGVVSYPDLLLMDLPENSPLRKPILTIQKSGERAAAVVQDLLILARRDVQKNQAVNLNDIVFDYLQSAEFSKLRSDSPHLKITTQLDPDLLNILGSSAHLSKIVPNLVSNASEAMPDGGIVKIETRNQHIDQLKTIYDDIVHGDYSVLEISDTGDAISKQDLERIFEPFYTKKIMGRGGTGLGMAVIWGTVKDHGGYIDISSQTDRGSLVTLYLPATTQEMENEVNTESLKNIQGKGERILVVDDIEEQRIIAKEILSKLGYSVVCVSSGEAAVEYVKHHNMDLLLLDMVMEPGIDGLETCRRILKIRPTQKMLIASGYSESGKIVEALKIGAGSYIKKPYLIEHIGRAVRAELES
jgi:PAS domain S-box-containing protein